jgi:hypothetical protein
MNSTELVQVFQQGVTLSELPGCQENLSDEIWSEGEPFWE